MTSQNEPKVSVIIPTYNMGQFVESALHSVLRQDFSDLEIIIVDDGSTDDTPQRMKHFIEQGSEYYDKRVRYFRKENGGKSTAVNLALQKVRGIYITILDADDELASGSLGRRFTAAQEKDADLVIGGYEVFKKGIILGCREAPRRTDPQYLRRQFFFSYKLPFSNFTCLFSRDLARRVGSFDERLRRNQDVDYSVRLLDGAKRVAAIDCIVYRYRRHRTSAMKRIGIRFKTIPNRVITTWKNWNGPLRGVVAALGVMLDLLKMGYELFGYYRK